jgi:hypothetical protein
VLVRSEHALLAVANCHAHLLQLVFLCVRVRAGPAGAPTAAPSMAASLAVAASGRVGGAGGSLSLDGGLGTPCQSVGVQ